MTNAPLPQWTVVLLGFLAGAGAIAVAAIVFVAAVLLAGWPVFLLIGMGFGGLSQFALVLVVAAVVALALPFAAGWAWHRLAGARFFATLRDGPARLAFAGGAVAGVAIAVALVPAEIKNEVSSFVTGQRPADRVALAATDDERARVAQRVRPAALAGDPAAQAELGLALQYGAAGEPRDLEEAAVWIKRAAAHPQGYEGRLLVAVSRRAEPVPRGGRIVTVEDAAVKAAALRALDLPAEWQPAVLGTVGQTLRRYHGTGHADDQPMRDASYEAGRARSRAYTVLAAAFDEAAATSHERSGRTDEADAGWRRAQQGYATAGAYFEVERLRVETLPERLEQFSDPPPAAAWPPPDAVIAERFWRFAWALDAEYVSERAPQDHRDLAASLALLAMERAPDPATMAAVRPARQWIEHGGPVGRLLLAMRHARGDCAAALELSNSIRSRRKTGFSNITPRVSMHDMAWAFAWAEAGERCAVGDEARAYAAERRLALEGMYLDKADVEQARAGVAATLATLR